MKSKRLIAFSFFFLAIGLFGFGKTTHAAAKTWDGGGADNNWSTPGNWDLDTVPATTDTITFNVTSIKNATIDNLGTWSGGTLTVASTYLGTITQNSGINLTTAAYSQAAGTVTMNAGATFTSTTFSVSGGTFNQGGAFTSTTFSVINGGIFVGSSASMSTGTVSINSSANLTATSGTWTLAGSWTQAGVVSTFTHNGGTIAITASSTFNDARSVFNRVTINTPTATVTISANTVVPLGASPSVSVGTSTLTVNGTITATGTLTITGNFTMGAAATASGFTAVVLDRNFTLTSGATWPASATMTALGSTITNVTATANTMGVWTVNKSAAAGFTVAAGTTVNLGASPTTTNGTGTLTVTGTLTFSGDWTHTGTITVSASGTVTGSGSPTLVLNQNLTLTSGAIWPSTMPITSTGTTTSAILATANTMGVWTVNKTNAVFTVGAGTTVNLGTSPTTVTGTGTFTVNGTLTFSGNWTQTGGLTVGSTGIVTGSGTPTLTLDRSLTLTSGATWPSTMPITATSAITSTITATANTMGVFTVNKTNADFTVAAGTTVNLGASPTTTTGTQTLTVTGSLTFSDAWTHVGVISVGAAGTVTGSGTPTLSLHRSMTLNPGATWPSTMPIALVGTSNSTLVSTANTTGIITVNKTGGAADVTIAANTTANFGANPNTTANLVKFFGTATASGVWTHTGNFEIGTTGTLSGVTDVNFSEGYWSVDPNAVFPAGLNVQMTTTTATSRTWYGGDRTFGNVRFINNGGATISMFGSDTFATFRDNDGLIPHAISFAPGITLTVTTWNLAGSNAKILMLASTTPGQTWTVTSPTVGNQLSDYVMLTDSIATGNSTWYAGANSVNGGNNTGWIFSGPPGAGGGSGGGGGGNPTPSIRLHSPNGGERIPAGSIWRVWWTFQGVQAQSASLWIAFDGNTYSLVASELNYATGFYDWTVPTPDTDTTSTMRVELRGAGGTVLASDESDGSFIIDVLEPPFVEPPAAGGPPDPYDFEASIDANQAFPAASGVPADFCRIHKLIKLPDDGDAATQHDSTVYFCGQDGQRHAFPNSKIYATWFANFNGVHVITPAQMAKLPLTQNVVYRPGARLIKIQTDPKVYAVSKGGYLRPIPDEAAAAAYFGEGWNRMVDDLDVGFFADYRIGPPLAESSAE